MKSTVINAEMIFNYTAGDRKLLNEEEEEEEAVEKTVVSSKCTFHNLIVVLFRDTLRRNNCSLASIVISK